jgi:hypothetical protein
VPVRLLKGVLVVLAMLAAFYGYLQFISGGQ